MFANVSLMSSVLLVQFITEIFRSFHLMHIPLYKTYKLCVCVSYKLSMLCMGVCARE